MQAASRFAVAAIVLGAVGLGCAPPRDPKDAAPARACDAFRGLHAPPDASLVLIVNDAMRRDRAGVYGGPAATPHLDAFARAHLLFRSASSAAPWTKPAIASLFTSLHPSQHGVRTHPDAAWGAAGGAGRSDVVPGDVSTLAEVLRAGGLRTGAFVANPWMSRGFGFEQGFDTYDASFARWDAPGRDVVDAALAWRRALEPGERYFLYLHTIDTHLPYGVLRAEDLSAVRASPDRRPLPAEASRYVSRLRVHDGRALYFQDVKPGLSLLERAYDRGVEAFDAALGHLLASLEGSPDFARTAVIVTSDHGEALFARGYGNHGRGLYEDELAIPLVARLPGADPERGEVRCPVGLVDLMPSLCEYLGVPCPAGAAGRSFLPGGADAPARYVVSEGVPRFASHRSVRNRRYKLIYAPEGPNVAGLGLPDARPERPYALYDLEEDPEEQRDLLDAGDAGGVREISDTLRAGLSAAIPASQVRRPETAPVDDAARRRLHALGYLEDAPDEQAEPARNATP